jgi:hypothetical protein
LRIEILFFIYKIALFGGKITKISGIAILSGKSSSIYQSDEAIAVTDAVAEKVATEDVEDNALSFVPDRSASVVLLAKNIGPLLKQHCEETQLYLQHDLTLLQLAKAVGTNRFYLSQ